MKLKTQIETPLLFENYNELMRLITQKIARINNIMGIKSVVTNAQEVNQMRQNYKLLYADKVENLGKMDNLKIHINNQDSFEKKWKI